MGLQTRNNPLNENKNTGTHEEKDTKRNSLLRRYRKPLRMARWVIQLLLGGAALVRIVSFVLEHWPA